METALEMGLPVNREHPVSATIRHFSIQTDNPESIEEIEIYPMNPTTTATIHTNRYNRSQLIRKGHRRSAIEPNQNLMLNVFYKLTTSCCVSA